MKKNSLKRIGAAVIAAAILSVQIPVNIDTAWMSGAFLQTVQAADSISYVERS